MTLLIFSVDILDAGPARGYSDHQALERLDLADQVRVELLRGSDIGIEFLDHGREDFDPRVKVFAVFWVDVLPMHTPPGAAFLSHPVEQAEGR
jgi:hypothetical protein